MHQEDAARRFRRLKSVNSDERHADDLQIVLRQNDAAIHQPRAARLRESAVEVREIHMTPVIVIARTSVNRRRDLADEIQCLRGEALVLHEIAGEEDKLRRQLIDRAHQFRRVGRVSLVVEICEMDETTSAVFFSGSLVIRRFVGSRQASAATAAGKASAPSARNLRRVMFISDYLTEQETFSAPNQSGQINNRIKRSPLSLKRACAPLPATTSRVCPA